MSLDFQLETQDWLQLIEAKSYLGHEFLMWVWYQSEHGDREVKFGKYTMRFWIDDRLLLENTRFRGQTHLYVGGLPSKSQEVALGLADGRLVKELRIGAHIEGLGDFSTILKGEKLEPQMLRLPIVPPGETDSLERRMEQMEVFSDGLDALFENFMSQRVASDWDEKILLQIRNWVANRCEEKVSWIH